MGTINDSVLQQLRLDASRYSFTGYKPFVGVFNELLVAESQDQISILFDYGILEYMPHGTFTNNTGDGVTTENNDGVLEVSSTTGTAYISSRDKLTYSPGHTCIIRVTAAMQGLGLSRFGPYNNDDGFALQKQNDIFYALHRLNGQDELVEINGNIDNINLENINIFYFMFGFLGVANPTFWILDKYGKPIKIHEFETIGSLQTTHLRTPVLPITMETSGDAKILSGSWQACVLGDSLSSFSQGFSNVHTAVINAGQTGLIVNYQAVVDFEYKPLITTKNKKKARLLRFQFFVDSPANGTGTVIFKIDAAMQVINPVWTEVSPYRSIMQYDVVGTAVPFANSITEFVGYSSSNRGSVSTGQSFNAEVLNLTAYTGDMFTIYAENIGSADVTVRISFNWEER